jgi:hypothetical protein
MRQSSQSPARVGVSFVFVLMHVDSSHACMFRWNPRHTPFVQLVNEMVDMDVQILQSGIYVADLPADATNITVLP